jgi:hypothetical protein
MKRFLILEIKGSKDEIKFIYELDYYTEERIKDEIFLTAHVKNNSSVKSILVGENISEMKNEQLNLFNEENKGNKDDQIFE